MTANRVDLIRNRLVKHLEPEKLEISDDSSQHIGHAGAAGGAGHFSVNIISSQFTDKSALERHRMVYQALNDLMPAEIHALKIQALSPEDCKFKR